jgi:hypothetical protein
MRETIAPVTQAAWSARERQLMSNLPYAQATIPEDNRVKIGTIVVVLPPTKPYWSLAPHIADGPKA